MLNTLNRAGSARARRHTRLKALAIGFCLAMAAGLPVAAQTPTAAHGPGQGTRSPGQGPKSWADMQREQAFATQSLEARLKAVPLRHEWVTIPDGERSIRAYVTYPQGTLKVPVVMVVHEVFGLTDSTLNTADQIARLGYITIAPDMVSGLGPNGGDVRSFTADHEASKTMVTMTDQVVDKAFNAVADYGLKLKRAQNKLAFVGLSWGGGAGFRYAGDPAHNPALKAMFVFYDVGPPTLTQGPNRLEPGQPPVSVDGINVPVYGFYGSLDTRVMKSLDKTRAAMAAAGKPYEPVVYEGAEHAFMRVGVDPANPNKESAAAAKAAMQRLREKLGTL